MLDPPYTPVEQCVILVGGLGTRLGELTRNTPKPLLPVAGIPFLEYLIAEAARHGFTRIVLLAGYLGGQFTQHYAGRRRLAGRDIDVQVVVEPEPAGTGGALRLLSDICEDCFLLMNGDSWCDIDLRAFASARSDDPPFLLRMALRLTPDASRFGVVELSEGRVRAFLPRGSAAEGLMNAGVYLVRRELLDRIVTAPCSLEADVFPLLAAEGLIEGKVYDAFLIDIGVPADYAAAEDLLRRHRTRPAVFLDRDGVLNFDKGYTHQIEELAWVPGALQAVRRINRAGCYAFVVSNQAGVARGYYDTAAVDRFHAHMSAELAAIGAHIDEFRYSPYHPDGVVEAYRQDTECRKPRPGMLLDLAQAWPVDLARSVLIGDKESDLQAAAAAGVRGVLFQGEDLDALVAEELARMI